MLIALFYLVLALGALVLILLAVVVAGIRREPPHRAEPPRAEPDQRHDAPPARCLRPPAGPRRGRPRDTCLAGHAADHSADGESR